MVHIYYGSTEYFERELEKAEFTREALKAYIAANFQENSKEMSASADKLAMLAELLERADINVREAKADLEKHLKAEAEKAALAEEGDK